MRLCTACVEYEVPGQLAYSAAVAELLVMFTVSPLSICCDCVCVYCHATNAAREI